MNLETIQACPICHSASIQSFLQCRDNTSTNERFQIQLCKNCTLGITSPRPKANEIGRYYQSASYISHTGKSTNLIDSIYLLARGYSLKRKRYLVESEVVTKNSILDYGCGTGQFLHECLSNGWRTQGIEPSQEAREKAIALIKQEIAPDSTQLTINQFDAITLWHVLEHVHTLNETLTQLTTSLKEKGKLFIAVPNYQSWDAEKYREHWAAYDVPRHLWHFSKKSMNQLLKNHGLKIEKIMPMKLDSYYVSLLSEKYKSPQQSKVSQYMNGFLNGMRSNFHARHSTNHSSLIYIAGR